MSKQDVFVVRYCWLFGEEIAGVFSSVEKATGYIKNQQKQYPDYIFTYEEFLLDEEKYFI